VASIRDLYLGPYRLLNVLATGQSTQIWEAMHDATRRRVAIKRLRAEPPKRDQIAMLRHEYQVGKKLDHPRLVKALELGTSRGETYLVLELFAVPNMKQWIQGGYERLAHLAERVLDEAAEGLSYLHEHGWIHRDVKPDNFLISREGEVKIIDFALAQRKKTGLARLFAGKAKPQGTPSYMSPEQIRGKPVDEKADVYSFGCAVYEFVSGKKPFTGMTPQELLSKHLGGMVPSLEAANRNVTPEFSALVKNMLSKQPSERPTIDDFRRELQSGAIFKTPPKPPDTVA
jgi:serine/threonine protein kinase